MPEYRIRETGEIVTDLATVFANVSIPTALSQEDYDALGVDPVLEGSQPATTRFQIAYRDGVEEINGLWFTRYNVVDMEQEAIDAMIEQQWTSVRDQRNRMLSESDWTQLSDSPLTEEQKQEWVVYRQALRDITTQEDPFNITWPEKP